MKVIAYLALGSNLGQPIRQLDEAVTLIQNIHGIQIQKLSSVYRSDPVGYTDQPDFYNMVVEIETTLSAKELLLQCQQVEKALNRERIIRFGPRTMDVDILFYDQHVIREEDLEVPHPRMKDRSFVVLPLAEIIKNVDHFSIPGSNETLSDWVAQLGTPDGIIKLSALTDLLNLVHQNEIE